MTSKEALKKLDHTICLNQNDNRLKFGYGKELNETCDCETFEEAVECIETIEKDLDKLEQHKKIEQELGIDLITFVKACLQNKIYSKFWDKYVWFTGEEEAIYKDGFYCYTSGQNELYLYKDYGKTWALTAEELENE